MEHLLPTAKPEHEIPCRIDLNALVLFYETVNVRSINKASAALAMPKSTISRRLRLLEQQMGSTLLKRGSRALSLTETGEALYARCERIMAELQQANLQTSQMQEQMGGVLRVSMPVFFIGWVSGAIADFAREHPALRMELEARNHSVDVADEPFDVVIHFGKPPETYHPSRKLAELPRNFYATPAYLTARGTPASYAELGHHDLIQHQYQVRDKIFPLLGQKNAAPTPLPSRIVVNHAVLVRELVLRDLGIGLMPDIMCRKDLSDGTLVRVPLDWQSPPLSVSATYLVRRYSPLKIRNFLDHLSSFLKTNG